MVLEIKKGRGVKYTKLDIYNTTSHHQSEIQTLIRINISLNFL